MCKVLENVLFALQKKVELFKKSGKQFGAFDDLPHLYISPT